jgi:ABC-type glycerol-3-phosphate transport system substrate-binding protein
MKKISKKQAWAFVMSLFMVIMTTACSGSSGTVNSSNNTGESNEESLSPTANASRGAYVETVPNIDGYSDIRGLTTYGNAIYFVAVNKASDGKRHIFRYENGTIEPLANAPILSNTVMGMTVNSQGDPVILTVKGEYVASETGVTPPITLSILKDGKFQAIGKPISDQFLSYSVAALENGEFLLGSSHGIMHLDSQGILKSTIGNGSITMEMAVSNKSVYTIMKNSENKDVLASFDIESGKKVNEMPLPFNNSNNGSLLSADSKGSLYIAMKDGICRLTAGGEKYEQLADGIGTILGDPNYNASDLIVTGNGNIIIHSINYTTKDSPDSIYCYAWSENALTSAQAKINIVSIYDYSGLRSIISDYQRAHKDIKINYQSYLPGYYNAIGSTTMDELSEKQVKLEDSVRAINTEVLSGNVPDVMILDGLPIQNYIDKGILDDMSKWAETRLTDGTWVEKIASAYRQKDGILPCIPTIFCVPTIWGEKSMIEGIKTLSDLASESQQLPKGQYPMTAYDSELLNMLYPMSAPDWMNDKGRIDFTSPDFKTFLEQLKAIQKAIPTFKTIEVDGNKYIDGTTYTKDYMSRISAFYMLIANNTSSFVFGNSLSSYREQTPSVCVLPGQSGKNVFYPSQIISVSAGSKNKEAAYTFLDYMTGEGLQKAQNTYNGLTIDKAALDKILSPAKTVSDDPQSKEDFIGQKLGINEVQLDDALCQRIKSILYNLDTPTVVDYTLLKMMIEEVMPYINDEKSEEQTISSLSARTKAYLAE